MGLVNVLVAICTLGSPDYESRVFATKTLDRVYLIPLLHCFKDCSDPEINQRVNELLNDQLNQTFGNYERWLYKNCRLDYYEKYFGASKYIDDITILSNLQTNPSDRNYVRTRLIAKGIITQSDRISWMYPGLIASDFDYYRIYGKLWQERP